MCIVCVSQAWYILICAIELSCENVHAEITLVSNNYTFVSHFWRFISRPRDLGMRAMHRQGRSSEVMETS